MKNQFFGDERDYLKYSLIRKLTLGSKLSTAVCWLLTPDASSSDGQKIDYLCNPESWRRYDPQIYDYLQFQVAERGVRDVDVLKTTTLLGICRFFSDIVHDELTSREEYFNRFFNVAEGSHLVFFDPDNGMEVTSVRRGNSRSSKYVYDIELERAFLLGHSLLIYQHFPRRPRGEFTREKTAQLQDLLEPDGIFTFHDSDVAFFLTAQPNHRALFESALPEMAVTWGRRLCIHGPIHEPGMCAYDW